MMVSTILVAAWLTVRENVRLAVDEVLKQALQVTWLSRTQMVNELSKQRIQFDELSGGMN